ncbi:putative aconitate hydratase [Aspergillus lentulus]|uniref:Aconitate hydratase n=1 Tax=Aspergillus lentulus TaxID=293939 RepID=A0AAN4TFC5_ASPLE|nr:putative aconitate hydratase [Aspergillus lentulus]
MSGTYSNSSVQIHRILEQTRHIQLGDTSSKTTLASIPGRDLIEVLQNLGHVRESSALADVLRVCTQPQDLGGLGLDDASDLSAQQESEVLFLVSAWLEALNSEDRSRSMPAPLPSRPPGRRGMTLSEKIFALHDIAHRGWVAPGDLIRVDVDWVIASEASWAGMETTYNDLGKPGIHRNDRFWLAGDHVVDPRIRDVPKVRALIDASERARRVFKMTEYQGMNYTILHTEFYRERAQPGMLIIGSDSHTCSSGALGCMAIGLGAADVTLPLVTGETWFKVPESINIRLLGVPKPGIGGKDVILYVLQQLKRNTVASERIIEFSGTGAQYLSADARFAICNMTAELGGITGVFVPDHVTRDFVDKRRLKQHKNLITYFRPDNDAQYAAELDIDLGNVQSFFARYPRPDDVVPVSDYAGLRLDGCFIGACTTTEEDLILAALLLEQGLKKGYRPVKHGKRKVVPGSMPILRRLRESCLTDVYEAAGFEIGVPGCSYCVGMSADQAAPGEVWLSSQNRNFENRMGKGHLGSAATVAASSFEMRLTDPHDLLCGLDWERWITLRVCSGLTAKTGSPSHPTFVEPSGSRALSPERLESSIFPEYTQEPRFPGTLRGKVQLLGDFIDTDALAPAEFLMDMKTNEQIGLHCLQYTHPLFRQRAEEGFNIVVAGQAFGCGSSREQAVMALLGCGIECVIAKSFAFIFQRNMPNLGLLGITMPNESFYAAAKDGSEISIDLRAHVIHIDGLRFEFELSQMEQELFRHGGITSAFRKFGNSLFEELTAAKNVGTSHKKKDCHAPNELQWTLALPESEDDPKIREKYRPFLLNPQQAAEDWANRLELDTVLDMAEKDLRTTQKRIKVLVLYGSLRKRSYSKLVAFEASRILFRLGCDVRVFNPEGLPVKDDVQHTHPKVQELRELSTWSDGHLWVSPEQHGNLTAVFKNQIDWIPLSTGSVRPTQGRTLAIAQVCGGSQSFNAVNSLRILGRWMRMFVIPNQSSIPKAYTHFPDAGQPGDYHLMPSGNRDRLVDCMEEFVKYTILMRPHFDLFADRYSEREERRLKQAAQAA